MTLISFLISILKQTMNYFYHVGGSVPPDSPSYIKREADEQLYSTLKNRQFCYVLNSRQMGKSSLWVQTQNRLKNEDIKCATISLDGLGNNLSEDNWYTILFRELVKAFDLSTNAKAQAETLWNGRSDTSPLYTLTRFIENILLEEVQQSIVICFDEIDSLLSLNFSSDPFFGFIRSCHEKRYTQPIYQRLTFCILGVATTADFIQNNTQSPFNIGKDIVLEGFSKGEALQLAQGLKGKVDAPERVLESILNWTGGQPFLTQKICQLIYSSLTNFRNQLFGNTINVTDFIRSQIIDNWESNDSPQHLKTIRNRLLNNASKTKRRLLELYLTILIQGGIKYNGSPEQIQLRLTGLVVQTEGKLQVYNQIYRNIFDEQWTENELNKIPPYIEQYESWLNSEKQSKYLLSYKQLQEAIEWSKKKTLNEQEMEFVQLSQFKTEILNWTGNQDKLTEIIFNIVVDNKNTLEEGKEQEFIKKIIQKYIIENWQSNQASEHLTNIKETILETDGNIKERLKIYKDLLQVTVLADNNPEKMVLLQSQLVIKKEDYLEVANPIYKEVFNLKWVNKQLEELINLERQQEVSRQSEKILSAVFEEDQRKLLVREILDWTGHQLKLTEIISKLVVDNKDTLQEGKEQEFIEQIIRQHIIENWQTNQASEHLTNIKEAILETDGNIKERLNIYKDILQVTVLGDNNPEKMVLLQSQLVIKKEDYLEVANPIYKAVFNQQWVDKQLEELINSESNPQPAEELINSNSNPQPAEESINSDSNNESNPEPATVYSSLVVTGIFIILVIVSIVSKITNTNSNIPNTDPPLSETTPEICVKQINVLTLEKTLENLQSLKEKPGDNFPLECQEKLNRTLYDKALKEGANNRVRYGVISLCQINEIPKDIEDARDKLKDWFDDSYWRDDVIESLSKIDNCPATEGKEFEQYLKKRENE